MSYEGNKEQLERWLYIEAGRWQRNKGDCFRFTEHEDGRGSVIFCTGVHSYHISFTDTYLGCTASCRTQRPGETWTRGSDLHDGPFSRDTFDCILRDIFAYELVALAPVPEPQLVEAEVEGPSLPGA